MSRTNHILPDGTTVPIPAEVYGKKEMLTKLTRHNSTRGTPLSILRAGVTREQDNEIQAAIPAAHWLQDYLEGKTVLLLSGLAGGGNRRVKHEALRQVLGCEVEWPDLTKMKRQSHYVPPMQRANVVLINPQGMAHSGYDFALQWCRKENKPLVILNQGYGLTQLTAAMYETLSKIKHREEETTVVSAAAVNGREEGKNRWGRPDNRKTDEQRKRIGEITANRWKDPVWLEKQAASGNYISNAAKRKLEEMRLVMGATSPVTATPAPVKEIATAITSEELHGSVEGGVCRLCTEYTADCHCEEAITFGADSPTPVAEGALIARDATGATPVIAMDAPPEISALIPLRDRLLTQGRAIALSMEDEQTLLDAVTNEAQQKMDLAIQEAHYNYNALVRQAQEEFHRQCADAITQKKAIENRVASIELTLSAWEVKGE